MAAKKDNHASNAPRTVNLGGQEYELLPLRRIDYKQMVQDAKKAHIDLARDAADGRPEAVQIHLLDAARQEASLFTLEHPQVQMRLVGFDGLCLVLWLSIKQKHPTLSYDDIVKLLGDEVNKETALQEVKDLHRYDELEAEEKAEQKKTKKQAGKRTVKRKARKRERQSRQ